MLRVTAVVFDSHDNSLVMQFNNGGIGSEIKGPDQGSRV